MPQERITESEKTMIRRINRRFELITGTNQIHAVLPLPKVETVEYGMIREVFNQHLVVVKDNSTFFARVFKTACVKKKYWKKHHNQIVDLHELSGKNLFNLIKEIKPLIEM